MKKLQDDSGAVIAAVMLVGAVLVALSSLMIARGFRQLVNTSNDTNWDNSLFAAEAALDDGLLILDQDFDFTTGETIPLATLGTEGEKDWALTAADARPASEVIAVAEGEYVLVRPSNSTVLFAIGYAPARDADARRVRVIRASVDGQPWTWQVEHALLVGKDLELSGNTTINDTNDNLGAAVHANGTVSSSGSYAVEGCLTSSLSSIAATSLCPPSPSPREPLPVIEPVLLYPQAHYLLCADETVYGGPAHPISPDPDLVPCSGNETIVALTDWTSKKQGGVVTWSTQGAADTSAVFYIHNGNFDGKLGSDQSPLEATVIVENGNGATCASPSTGNVEMSANSNVTVHPSMRAIGYDILFVAQGDVRFRGGATVGGAILAHEQIDYRGNAGSWGGVVAVDVCDTNGSPVSTSKVDSLSTTTGAATINFPGPIQTPFTANSLRPVVTNWYEL
jgi:hypothetical protein